MSDNTPCTGFLLLVVMTLAAAFTLPACDNEEDAADADAEVADTREDADDDAATDSNDGGDDADPFVLDTDYREAGPYAAGVTHFTTSYPSDGELLRHLNVEVWYPAAASGDGETLSDFVADDDRAAFDAQLSDAITECINADTGATRDAEPLSGSRPALVFSHCSGCTRFSSVSLMEHLASWGYVVASADHDGNTLFDETGEGLGGLTVEMLRLRITDVQHVFSQLRAVDGDLPADVAAVVDREGDGGILGHSFGSVTTGAVAARTEGVGAAAGIMAPLDFLGEAAMPDINVPLLLVLAEEDNSITSLGNQLIDSNFQQAQVPVWQLNLADAGHFSISDLCGYSDIFSACCGEDARQTNGATFTYRPRADVTRDIAGWITALFESQLRGEADADTFLRQPDSEFERIRRRNIGE